MKKFGEAAPRLGQERRSRDRGVVGPAAPRRRTLCALVALVCAGWGSVAHAHDTPSAARGGHDPCPTTTGTTTTTQATLDPITERELARPETPTTWKAKPNRALLITGATMFASSYATTGVVGLVSPLDADEHLFIPVVGPWMNLVDRPCGLGACGGKDDIANALILGGGITQAAGLGLAILSLVVPERRESPVTAGVRITPLSFGRGGGLGAVGRF